jgi:hypothetical protein
LMLYIIMSESVSTLVTCNSLVLQLETTVQMCLPSHFHVHCLKSIGVPLEFILIGLSESVKKTPMHGVVT